MARSRTSPPQRASRTIGHDPPPPPAPPTSITGDDPPPAPPHNTDRGRGRRPPAVTVRPLSDDDSGAASAPVPIPLHDDQRRKEWQGSILLSHPGRTLLLAVERPRGRTDVRYTIEARRSPGTGITSLDLGE